MTKIYVVSKISGFLRGVDKAIALLGCYAKYNGRCSPTFRENKSVLTSRAKESNRIFFDCLTMKDETYYFAQNVSNKLPTYAMQHRGKSKNLSLVVFIFILTSLSLKINKLVNSKPLSACQIVREISKILFSNMAVYCIR